MGDGWNGVTDRVVIQILRRMTWYSRWEKGGLMMGFRRITCMRKRTHIVHAYPREQLGSKEMKRIEKTSGSRSFLSNVGPSQGSRECQSIPSNMVRREAARGDGLDLIMSPSHVSTETQSALQASEPIPMHLGWWILHNSCKWENWCQRNTPRWDLASYCLDNLKAKKKNLI